MKYSHVKGATARRDIRLLDDDETPSGTMSGMTAEWVLTKVDGTLAAITVEGEIVDEADWTVGLPFVEADPLLTPGEYYQRAFVTDSDGEIKAFPDGAADILAVLEP